jgi:hypothetical protein
MYTLDKQGISETLPSRPGLLSRLFEEGSVTRQRILALFLLGLGCSPGSVKKARQLIICSLPPRIGLLSSLSEEAKKY